MFPFISVFSDNHFLESIEKYDRIKMGAMKSCSKRQCNAIDSVFPVTVMDIH